MPPTETEVGSGELNKADSWDDFPNGRWGDSKSPAYGVQGPWGNNDAIVSMTTWHLLIEGVIVFYTEPSYNFAVGKSAISRRPHCIVPQISPFRH